MLMCNQHIYKCPAIEVYGQHRLLLPWLVSALLICFAIWGWKIAGMDGRGLNPQY